MSVGVELAPHFTASEAETLSDRLFGVRGSARPLTSERDQNFRVDAGPDGVWVLKLANADEPPECLAFQCALLERLAEAGLPFAVPRVRRAPGGEAVLPVEAGDGRRHLARMLTWVEGHPLAEARTRPAPLLSDVGCCLGRLDRALEGFDHPGARRVLRWDVVQAAGRRGGLPHVTEPARHALAERLLDRFESRLAPALAALPPAVVHGDWHEHNLLLDAPDRPERRLVGVVDFGDALLSHRVCDPAVAIAYAMLGQSDPLAAAAQLCAGYAEVVRLEDEELALLWELARIRLVVSVLNTAEQASRAPDNEYLRVSEAPAWELLEQLEGTNPDWAHYRLRDACGRVAFPGRDAGLTALAARADDFGPVMGLDLSRALVLDFSTSSPEFEPPESLDEVRAMAATIEERVAAAGASAGLGRYDEARIVYTGEAFRSGAGPEARWRTVHLGIDVFAAAGEPVLAPLDGEVHSFADNAAPLDYGPTVILRHRLEPEGVELYSLYGHLSRESLVGLSPGKAVRRGERVGTLGDESVNGGWAPHLHFQLLLDTLGRRGDFPGVAAPEERSAWLGLCPDPNLVLRVPGLTPAPRGPDRESLLAARREHFSSALSVAYREPLVIVRGRRQFLFDPEGRPYLDAVNNIAHVGHSHPRVVAASSHQAALLNTNTRYLHPLRAEYARRLTALLPEPLSVVFLVCTGSEANELALRIARAHTGGRANVVLGGGYHGHTTTLVGLSPYKHRGPGGAGPDHGVYEVPAPDAYRGPHRGADAGERYAGQVAQAVSRAQRDGAGPPVFIAESLPGCAGQIDPPAGFFAGAYQAVREAGGVCIADEVQVGFGRVGERFWGFELQDVVPDIVTLGKPIGNGHPLAAVVTTPQIARSFETGMEYFNSFGGNPVSCAVGLAVLDVIEQEGLQENARRTGQRLLEGLRALAERYPLIGDVRGRGLFLGVELVRNRDSREPAGDEAAYVVERMKQLGVLISRDGPLLNVLKIKPPLVFGEADADRLVEALAFALGEDFPRTAPERAEALRASVGSA